MGKKIIGICFVLLLFLGCNKSCNKTSNRDPIFVAISLPIETIDPRLATSFSASRVSNLIFGTLFVIGEDLNPTPWLSEKFEQVDNKTYQIILKKNLTFHDGSPLTSKDVVYTFSNLSSKDVLSPHAEKFSYIESITAKDDYTIEFKLKEPFAPFLTDLCGIGIVSKKQCENRSKECEHEYVGSGPFRVKSWNRAKETIWLEPFSSFVLGAPKNDIVVRIVRDENTRILELKNGKTDIVDGDLSPERAFDLKQEQNLLIKEIPGLGYTYLGINMRSPTLSKKNVRLAIAKAIDFEQIIEKILHNKAKRASGLIPPRHWAKDDTLKTPNFDPNESKKLLESLKLTLTITTTQSRINQSIALLFADFLKQVGINTNVKVKDWSALYDDMKKGQFELFIATWTPITEPNIYEWVHHSKNIPSENKNGGNRHGYKNPYVDKLIDEGRITTEQALRRDIYQKIEKILLEDLPYIPLWHENRIVIINKSVKNYEPKSTGSFLGLINAYKEIK